MRVWDPRIRRFVVTPEVRITIATPPAYTASEVAAIRISYGLIQRQFAELLNVSVSTLRNWEQGRLTPPDGYARLLQLFESFPDEVRRQLIQGLGEPVSDAAD